MAIISTLVGILMALCVILLPVGLVVGIVLMVQSSAEQDPAKKKKKKRWGVTSILGPVVLMFVLLSLWGLMAVVKTTLAP